MISLSGLLHFVVLPVVLGLVFYLLSWLLTYCAVPEPWNKVGRVVLAVLAVVILCGLLLSLVSPQPLFRP